MSQFRQIKQQIIYFDYTAGRGSFDDEYQESNVDISHLISSKENEVVKDHETTENRCTFNNFSEIKPHQLSQQSLNQIQHQRRHSYNRGPLKGRATGRNYSQQQQNATSLENNNQVANIQNFTPEIKNKISNSQSHSPDSLVTLNWAPIVK
ncbi:hypothetical protein M9Y10_035981 [Tritrichomonas musculus]|uniref:Uncharacterized protein n=1 Tax=Tritrichomonas musculus TaxID=1915356 RepID=A0ABR2GVS7_9EUKA